MQSFGTNKSKRAQFTADKYVNLLQNVIALPHLRQIPYDEYYNIILLIVKNWLV